MTDSETDSWVHEFAEATTQVRGYRPFPWQDALLRQVIGKSAWPAVIDVPTGAGKTTCIDVGLKALSVAPHNHPRRIFLVVDRRIIVDQAADHARHLQHALHQATSGSAKAWADRLRATFGGGAGELPFEVAVLRGGIPRDNDWMRAPDRPAVILSTVDQVGSRLLFRGYGVSTKMAPVHAGLVGNDALYLLDEVHLSEPFAQTLGAIATRWRPAREKRPFVVVRLSATPGHELAAEHFGLTYADHEHPILKRRLGATKPTQLAEITTSGDENKRRYKFSQAVEKSVRQHLAAGHKKILVVVNRVATARQVHELITEGTGPDAILLTGRMRALDREATLDATVLEQIRAGRTRCEDDRSLVVVATQCVEAGADFDFDALVTECASLDALRQRFGRLDRLGDYDSAAATVLVRKDQLGNKADDPIYGDALKNTWRHLSDLDAVDFGLETFVVPTPSEAQDLLAPKPNAPILLPAHLDALVMTAPPPIVSPDISLWLHGPKRGAPDVQIVWRADLDDADLERRDDENATKQATRVTALLASCPPTSPETLSVPIYAARAWLHGEQACDVADVEGFAEPDAETKTPKEQGAKAVRYGGNECEVICASGVRPGDTLVVPSSRGGLRNRCWEPLSLDPVQDLGELAFWQARKKPLLRLHAEVLRGWGYTGQAANSAPQPLDEATDRDLRFEVRGFVETLLDEYGNAEHSQTEPARARTLPRELLEALRRPKVREGNQDTLVLEGRYIRRARQVVTSEDDNASFVERRHTLAGHCGQVGKRAEDFARALGLDDALVDDLRLAGQLHDIGKVDPRFQRWLVGGSEIARLALKQPLAKSARPSTDFHAMRESKKRAGYPDGARHELVSVALAMSNDDVLAHASDVDLVLHLIGSHHGYCRPFAPAFVDEDELEVRFERRGEDMVAQVDHRLGSAGSAVADRFWALTERYGWWGLSWLESILRLADHRVSEEANGG